MPAFNQMDFSVVNLFNSLDLTTNIVLARVARESYNQTVSYQLERLRDVQCSLLEAARILGPHPGQPMIENAGHVKRRPDGASGRLRFGGFELDLGTRELLRDGRPVKLQQQPCRVLAVLASRPGELVTREEIRKAIWGADTWVNFDQGLNFCIKEVRAALGDSADAPRFVETLPRRGYRFIAGTSVVSPGRASLAVLPFDDLSPDHRQDYVCEALASQLVAELVRARPEQVSVISRRSTQRFRSGDDVGVIGRALGADFVVEGVLKKDGNRFRVSARLIRVENQVEAWADSFEHDRDDPATPERGLARSIAGALTSALLRRG